MKSRSPHRRRSRYEIEVELRGNWRYSERLFDGMLPLPPDNWKQENAIWLQRFPDFPTLDERRLVAYRAREEIRRNPFGRIDFCIVWNDILAVRTLLWQFKIIAWVFCLVVMATLLKWIADKVYFDTPNYRCCYH